MRPNDAVVTAPVSRQGAAAVTVTVGWAASLGLSTLIVPGPAVRDCALLVHLVSLVAGMGAVLTVDWYAARWLLGRQERSDVVRLVGGAHSLIWLGLVGLVASGTVLQPDLGAPATRLKLVAVLVLALNGLRARSVQRLLEAPGPLTRSMALRAGTVAAVSQVGWWTALVVGFLNGR